MAVDAESQDVPMAESRLHVSSNKQTQKTYVALTRSELNNQLTPPVILRAVTVIKPSPYNFDLGNLLALDPNPLPSHSNITPALLRDTARDGAQSLINQLLTTCPITSDREGLLLTLPSVSTITPRAKPLPKLKAPTTWEKFARKKGIGKYNATGGKTESERRKKLVYDEEKGEWVPRWGYKGKNKDGEGTEWLVELDDKQLKKETEAKEGTNIRAEGRRERLERVRRNERKMRANERKARKGGGG